MRHYLLFAALILHAAGLFAKGQYQVDLIIFAQPGAFNSSEALRIDAPLPASPKVQSLTSNSSAYRLLTPSQSQLKDEFYQLGRKKEYTILGQYSWVQPLNNKSPVMLPFKSAHGWNIQGTVNIKNGAYYLFNADLQVNTPTGPNGYLRVIQNQRIKPNVVYYFDHPLVGVLVKIVHKSN